MTRKAKYIGKYLNIHKDVSVLSQLKKFLQKLECIMIPDMASIFSGTVHVYSMMSTKYDSKNTHEYAHQSILQFLSIN